MKNLLEQHFNELLLAFLSLVLTAIATWILAKEGWQAADGFKWASGLVGTVIGALLAMLMKQNTPSVPPKV